VRSPSLAGIAAGVVGLLTIASCGVPTGDASFEPIEQAEIPLELSEPSTTTSTTTTTTTTTTTLPDAPDTTTTTVLETTTTIALLDPVVTYFISRGDLERVQQSLTLGYSRNQLVTLLEEGPPEGSVLDTFIEPGLIVTTTERGGVVTIDLDEDLLAAIDTRNQRRAFAQIVLTFTDNLRGVGQVVFTLAGDPIGVPKGNALFSQPGEPVSGDDYTILLVDAPGAGPDIGEPVTGTTIVPDN